MTCPFFLWTQLQCPSAWLWICTHKAQHLTLDLSCTRGCHRLKLWLLPFMKKKTNKATTMLQGINICNNIIVCLFSPELIFHYAPWHSFLLINQLLEVVLLNDFQILYVAMTNKTIMIMFTISYTFATIASTTFIYVYIQHNPRKTHQKKQLSLAANSPTLMFRSFCLLQP